MIKLLIADNSALMRKLLEGIFLEEGDFDIRLARNGSEALELMRSFDPQVVTLDVQMPGMDGLVCLGQIMIEAPRPVVMISALTEEGAEATLEAIELGAVDFVAKPGGTISLEIDRLRPLLVEKVRGAANAKISADPAPSGAHPAPIAWDGRRVGFSGQKTACTETWQTGFCAGSSSHRNFHRRTRRARCRASPIAPAVTLAGARGTAYAGDLHRPVCQASGTPMRTARGRGQSADAVTSRHYLHWPGRR